MELTMGPINLISTMALPLLSMQEPEVMATIFSNEIGPNELPTVTGEILS
jgi:hypothetical protein